LNKQVEGKIRNLTWIGDQRTKKQGNKGTAAKWHASKVAYTCRYTSVHLIPNLVMVIAELGTVH